MKRFFAMTMMVIFVGGAVAAKVATSAVTDTVKKLREDDEGVVVLFVKTTGSFYLRRDTGSFEVYRGKLEKSLNEKKPVSVTADSAQLNILEVK